MSKIAGIIGKIAAVVAIAASIALLFVPGGQVFGVALLTIATAASAVSAVAMAVSQATAKPPDQQGTVNQVLIGKNMPVPYVMGRTYIGGMQVYDKSANGPDNYDRTQIFVGTVAGPIDSFESFQADYTTITFSGGGSGLIGPGVASGFYGADGGYMWASSRRGLRPETAHVAVPPRSALSEWGTDHKLSGYASWAVTMEFDEDGKRYASGIPQYGMIAKWVRVYDPRKDATYPGGVGTHRWNKEDTFTYGVGGTGFIAEGENPALHALTYARGRFIGDITTGGNTSASQFFTRFTTTLPSDEISGTAGVLVGNAYTDTANRQLVLDGTGDYVTFPGAAINDEFDGDWTLEMHTTAAGGDTALIARGASDAVTGRFILYMSGAGATIQLYARIGAGAVQLVVGASGIAGAGTNRHLAVVRQAGNYRLYVNGVQVASAAVAGTILASADDVWIGADPAGGRFVNGRIGRVNLAGEALYKDGTTFVPPGLDASPPTASGPPLATAVRVMGCGFPKESIRIAQFVELANICDANGWKIGGAVYEGPGISKWENLKRILAACAAEPVWVGGMLGLKICTPKVALFQIGADDLADGDVEIAAMRGFRDLINTVVPRVRLEAQKWEYTQIDEITSSTYLAEDGETKTKEVQYDLVQDKDQGAELAAYEIVNSRELGPWSVPLKPYFLPFRPGEAGDIDLGEITGDPSLGVRLVVITGRSVDPGTGIVTLTLETETTSKHAFALGQTGVAPPTPTILAPDVLDQMVADLNAAPTVSLALSSNGFLFVDGIPANPSQVITVTAAVVPDTVVTWSVSPVVTLGAPTPLSRTLTLANFGSNLFVTITAQGANGAITSIVIPKIDYTTPSDSIIPDSLVTTSVGGAGGGTPWQSDSFVKMVSV